MDRALDFLTLARDGEAIRAVIWDLDETFWRGTITEGGISEYRVDAEDLVVELAKRGIVSGICSKNDSEVARALLVERGVWDYFVFPSIDWSPKGARVGQIVEALQLRPETVLFIDDNRHNLADAAATTPGLLVASEEVIASLRDHPRLRGKVDPELSRLGQYKLLEQRARDQRGVGGDPKAFLRNCGVVVTIEPDVAAHLERAVELINRTNQLNFTKHRLSADVEEAKRQLREELSHRLAWAGLVKVTDRYGDYGFVGFFLGHTGGVERLHHFCFSCRTIGMDVETWVYRRLGEPKFQVAGEVLVDLKSAHVIDWINSAQEAGDIGAKLPNLSQVRLRGGCELEAIPHYFGPDVESFSEVNFNSAHLFLRRDSVSNMGTFQDRLETELRTDLMKAGVDPKFFDNATFAESPTNTLIIISFWSDVYVHHFRHRQSGQCVAFSLGLSDPHVAFPRLENDPGADIAEFLSSFDSQAVERRQAAERLARGLAKNFQWIGAIPVETYEHKLHEIVARSPEGARLAIVQPPLRALSDGQPDFNPRVIAFREATLRVAYAYSYARAIDAEEAIAAPWEVKGAWHFDRIVYFRLYDRLRRELSSDEGRGWPCRKKTAEDEAFFP
jgi:FkbH-like protein